MRKNYGATITTNKLLTLTIATVLAFSIAIAIPKPALALVSAAPGENLKIGTGQGSIFYTAHRLSNVHWDPCFASSCDQGSGPGTWVFFVVWESNVEVGSGYANEDGTYITGLEVGKTYYIEPSNCFDCAKSEAMPHDVMFNNWWDCDTSAQRPFAITSGNLISASAYYRYHLHGEVDQPVACTPTSATTPNGSPPPSTQPPSSQPPSNQPPGNQPPPKEVRHRHRINVDVAELDSVLNLKQALLDSFQTSTASVNETTTASENGTTTIAASMIPDSSLSGVPLGKDGHVVTYTSYYDLAGSDPDGVIKAMTTAEQLDIDWGSLSDMQKAYLMLTLAYNMPSGARLIPDTNLSGVPLGPDGKTVEYKSLYDISSNNSDGLIKAMHAADQLGVDWNGLSDMQKAYLATVLSYGAPQK